MNTDQIINVSTIRRFLVRTDTVSFFLILGLLFAVFVVVFFQPQTVLTYTSQTGPFSHFVQLTLMSTAGYLIVAVSRTVLLFYGKHKKLSLLAMLLWLAIELVVCVAVTTVVAWLVGGLGPLKLAPLAGEILLGYFGVFLLPTIISFQSFRIYDLRQENVRLHRRLLESADAQFATGEQKINFYDKGGRLAMSTRADNVLYIEAADNYANIHYLNENKEDTFILHNSLKEIEKDYQGSGLIRCHRGYMVNVANVKLMRKEKGGLLLELNVTTRTIPVSKSYVSQVMRIFSGLDVAKEGEPVA
jgi:hypothetical protein